MEHGFRKTQAAVAAVATLGTAGLAMTPPPAAAAKVAGRYVAGDFHNHTTCSDGSMSLQKLVKKATDRVETPWGLDWFVQAGHGNSGGTRNCTLTEDSSLDTPLYPYVAGTGPETTWAASIGVANVKGDTTSGVGYMWRWQSIQEYQYPALEYLSTLRGLPLFQGIEQNPPGHEHLSMSIITRQMPASLDTTVLPATPKPITGQRYLPVGNADALAQHTYCFDRTLTDRSRGNVTGSSVGNNWDCSNPSSPASFSPALGFNDAAKKLIQPSGTGSGNVGHLISLEAVKWMRTYHPDGSYWVPAHLERAGPFNPNGSNGYNVEHLRDFNNAAPRIAFGFETQPGHGASGERGEYFPGRNNIGGVLVDSVGGTTYGGTGVYGGYIGGVWDALLGEGRNWWFFASSDSHNRGIFGNDDRRSTQDFQPGEYQRNYTMVRNGSDKLRPQSIVDGLRTGNDWTASGQLIDRLAFVACASYAGPARRSDASVQALAVTAATGNTDTDLSGCATMGENLIVRPGAEIVVAVVVRDPAGPNYAPYTFPNPSIAQVSTSAPPVNLPELHHVDLIRGLVTGYRTPGSAEYAGQWPNTWLSDVVAGKTKAQLDATIPVAAKNPSAAVIRTFSASGASPWSPVTSTVDGTRFLAMTYRIPAVSASQYVRLRGTNLPPAIPSETDADGNPLPDLFTNATTTVTDATATTAKPAAVGSLRIACTATGSNVPANGAPYTIKSPLIDGCPNHLPTVHGVKYVAYDVAAWSDLWFYSNPIFVEVAGGAAVAGVQ